MCNRAVRSSLPPSAVVLVSVRVVDVHLDQIFVCAVVAGCPAAVLILDLSSLNTEVAASEAWPNLGAAEPVRFAFPREVTVLRIAC